MAGVGVKLNRIFEKETLTTHIVGFGYSAVITVAPMFVIIGAIGVTQWVLGYSDVSYARRDLFADTVLYVFIFALLVSSPFNAVLSRYLSDVIFKERYQDIMPCFYVGLTINVILGTLVSIPFLVHEHIVGEVELYYVFTSYCAFLALILVFYSMLYLNITKDYIKISACFTIGMTLTVFLALFLVWIVKMEMTYALLLALAIGLLLIASLEIAIVQSYFRQNSRQYREVLRYFKKYWQLVLINFFYTLGLYIHNFVFWTTDMRVIVVRSFVTMPPYDMATCLAMFTNISATIIFITRIEMFFHARYKAYSEAVIGGRGHDIRIAKRRLFRQLAEELMTLVRLQFIITVVVFLACIVLLPQFGFGGSTMDIYPCLAAGYFILFVMYSEILFLYYFNDLTGALWTTLSFCLVTMAVTVVATHLADIWYGIGVVMGSAVGFTIAYFRLRWVERNLDYHIFCAGSLLKSGSGKKPPGKVMDLRDPALREAGRKETKKKK